MNTPLSAYDEHTILSCETLCSGQFGIWTGSGHWEEFRIYYYVCIRCFGLHKYSIIDHFE